MNATEGLRRIARGVGYIGWLPLVLVIFFTLQDLQERGHWPRDALLNTLFAILALSIFKGIEWIILGFATPKRSD
jgi:hypothetical protein